MTETLASQLSDHLQHDQMARNEMPIQVGNDLDLRERQGERPVIVRSIPWEMIAGEAGERQSQRNHGQTLEEIAKRSGFSACEAICVMASMPWKAIGTDADAHRILYAMKVLFNRGQRVAEATSAKEARVRSCR